MRRKHAPQTSVSGWFDMSARLVEGSGVANEKGIGTRSPGLLNSLEENTSAVLSFEL